MLSFFTRDVLDEILNLIESVSEGFPSYSFIHLAVADEIKMADLKSKIFFFSGILRATRIKVLTNGVRQFFIVS